MEIANELPEQDLEQGRAQPPFAVATGLFGPHTVRVWYRAGDMERTVEAIKAQEAGFPGHCRLALFHQQRSGASFAP